MTRWQADFRLLLSETLSQVCTGPSCQGLRLSSALSFHARFFSTQAFLHCSVFQAFSSRCLPISFQITAGNLIFIPLWQFFNFFLFLLLFNCEKYFLLQEKCPYTLFVLGSCCSLFAESHAVVFNVHHEMSIPFHLHGGRNPFDIIYETSCGSGPSHLTRLSLCSTIATK